MLTVLKTMGKAQTESRKSRDVRTLHFFDIVQANVIGNIIILIMLKVDAFTFDLPISDWSIRNKDADVNLRIHY
jgi:hypothetical protein